MNTNNAVQKIRKEFNENKNSHVFLIETNDVDKCLNDIKELIIEIIGSNDDVIKEQIKSENYLELIIISPDGKDIKKEQILDLQERLKIKPILSKYLFYIILDAELLNESSSNKLLKTIEEPNESVVSFLIAKNIDLLLPTIKSRCEMLSIMYDLENNSYDENPSISNDTLFEMIKLIETKDLLEFNLYKDKNKEINDNGKEIVKTIKRYYNTACEIEQNWNFNIDIVNFIKDNNSYREIVQKSLYLNKVLDKLTFNMNTDLLLEKIFLEIRK